MKLGLAQFEIEAGAPTGNRERALEYISTAARQDVDIVVLPELFTAGYFAFDHYAETAESAAGETIQAIAAAAADHGMAVVAGSIVEDLSASDADGIDVPAPDGLSNTTVFLDANGNRRAIYRKHHLFGYESAEAELLTPGEHLPTVTFGGFTIGMSTCYDLRFPELYRALAGAGVSLVLVPSAWPYPRVEHWRLLPRARAVENLTYVAAANGVGDQGDAELLGRSAVYDPWGSTIASAGDEERLITAAIDPDRVAEIRSEFPALDDRREIYSQ